MEARHQNAEVADEFVKEFALTMTKEEFVRGGRERSLPVAPVSTFSDVSRSEQLAARKWFQYLQHPAMGNVRMPDSRGICAARRPGTRAPLRCWTSIERRF